MIPYGQQDISDDDVQAVVEVLNSAYLTQGPCVPRFENQILQYCGASYGAAVNSATSALHLACLALDVGPGDLVWTSPISFVASANCALYCGASIDFVDIEFSSNNMCVGALEEKLEEAEKRGRLPKIIIPVHIAGYSCDMEKIYELSQKYDFRIIEDASHAIGGKYQERPIGCCDYSDITVFSFHPVKIITTAEGGIAVTNDQSISEKLNLLRSHGITRDASKMTGSSEGGWYYQQIDLGFNYRMTDIQAALGSSQLSRIDSFIEKRHILKSEYDKRLVTQPLYIPLDTEDRVSAQHLYVIKVRKEYACLRKGLYDHLRECGIGVNVHYIPIHLQPYYRKLGFSKGDFPVAEEYYESAISIPMHPKLSMAELEHVTGSITEFFIDK